MPLKCVNCKGRHEAVNPICLVARGKRVNTLQVQTLVQTQTQMQTQTQTQTQMQMQTQTQTPAQIELPSSPPVTYVPIEEDTPSKGSEQQKGLDQGKGKSREHIPKSKSKRMTDKECIEWAKNQCKEYADAWESQRKGHELRGERRVALP